MFIIHACVCICIDMKWMNIYFQVVDLDKFITHELPFDKINEAFQLLVEGKSLRCLLHF